MALQTSTEMLNNLLGPKNFIIRTGTGSTSRQRIHWASGGVIPSTGIVDTSTIGGVIQDSNTTGALYFPDSFGLSTKIFNLSLFSNVFSYFLLIDRLWECSVTSSGSLFSITDTLPQEVNSIQWPPRDIDGTTNGKGVYIAVVSNGGWSSGNVSISMDYTNSSNEAGRIGTTLYNLTGNPVNGDITYFSLQAGDIGVKSIQSITLTTTATAGTFHLIAFKPVCFYLQTTSMVGVSGDFLSHPLPEIIGNPCFAIITQPSASAAQVQPFTGYIEYSQT